MEYYILFEESSNCCYGDFIASDKLFTKEEAYAYAEERAFGLQPSLSPNKEGFFSSTKQHECGTGLFYFYRVHL
jgi:hypothetical protein